jgi:hypothetical protein
MELTTSCCPYHSKCHLARCVNHGGMRNDIFDVGWRRKRSARRWGGFAPTQSNKPRAAGVESFLPAQQKNLGGTLHASLIPTSFGCILVKNLTHALSAHRGSCSASDLVRLNFQLCADLCLPRSPLFCGPLLRVTCGPDLLAVHPPSLPLQRHISTGFAAALIRSIEKSWPIYLHPSCGQSSLASKPGNVITTTSPPQLVSLAWLVALTGSGSGSGAEGRREEEGGDVAAV